MVPEEWPSRIAARECGGALQNPAYRPADMLKMRGSALIRRTPRHFPLDFGCRYLSSAPTAPVQGRCTGKVIQMSKAFRQGWGDWQQYRPPDCLEVDLHFGKRDPRAKSYQQAMDEVTALVERTLREAQREGRPYVMFIHGRSTSRRGKMTARSRVRGFMRSPKATPLIQRSECIQHPTIFVAKVRLSPS